ncbi:hypothetical protein C8R44DRAFT_978221 [Mycena epipterygia]|nr:hypothetical protein C8R44DRAFT_978221 [Mycena epipterygia]
MSMLLLLFANMVLIIFLALSNWDHVLLLFSWFYALASRWMTTSTILVIYGLVLVYLLLVVHGPAVTQDATRKRRKNPLVPYYDENGQLQGWVREQREMTKTHGLHEPLAERLSSPPLRGRAITLPPPPGPSTSFQTVEALPNFPLTNWDGFPDYRFRCHFTRQQVEDTSRLSFYWISDKRPGKRGSLDAITPEKGKLSRFKCAGIIQCKGVPCTVQIAPGPNVARQLGALCACGLPLRHRACEVEWSVVFYRDGAVFENSGPHNHSKYTHSLPTSKNKKTLQLQEFISKQPIVFRGSEASANRMSESDGSRIGEDEESPQSEMEPDADEGVHCKDQHGHDSEEEDVDESGVEMDFEDERRLDPEADEDE